MELDWSWFWCWFLIFLRLSGLVLTMPGLGTDEIPYSARGALVIVVSCAIATVSSAPPLPTSLAQGGVILAMEFLFGYLVGLLPAFVIASLAVAGHMNATAIGLAQASMIDPSLGEHVTVVSRFQSLLGTSIFLAVDGHHLVLRAISGVDGPLGLGSFYPTGDLSDFLVGRLASSLEFSLALVAPILMAVTLTNFVLGLITKFVPQVNIFIISLPLTIGLGLFLTELTLPSLTAHVICEFGEVPEVVKALIGQST